MPGAWPEQGKDLHWTLSHQGQVRPGGCAHPEPSEATVAGVTSSQMEAAEMEPGTPSGKDPAGPRVPGSTVPERGWAGGNSEWERAPGASTAPPLSPRLLLRDARTKKM